MAGRTERRPGGGIRRPAPRHGERPCVAQRASLFEKESGRSYNPPAADRNHTRPCRWSPSSVHRGDPKNGTPAQAPGRPLHIMHAGRGHGRWGNCLVCRLEVIALTGRRPAARPRRVAPPPAPARRPGEGWRPRSARSGSTAPRPSQRVDPAVAVEIEAARHGRFVFSARFVAARSREFTRRPSTSPLSPTRLPK